MRGAFRWINQNLEETVCAGLLFFMATVAFLNVLVRYLTRYSLAFTEEIVVSLMVWLTLFGAAAGFKYGVHLGLNFLVLRFPRPARVVAALGSGSLAVALFLALIWFSIRQIQDEIALATTSEALAIPQWLYTLGLPLGSILVIWRVIQATWRNLRALREP